VQGRQSADGDRLHFDNYHFVFFVSEGRINNSSVDGFSLYEMAGLLRDYGCVRAYNLDGGGASYMWYDGSRVNTSSEESLGGGYPLCQSFLNPLFKRTNASGRSPRLEFNHPLRRGGQGHLLFAKPTASLRSWMDNAWIVPATYLLIQDDSWPFWARTKGPMAASSPTPGRQLNPLSLLDGGL
jgi:hypothetical protein